MATKRKKKLKLKKKNFTIFISCILLIIVSICYATSLLSKPETKKNKVIKKTKEEIKLNKLKNIDQKINYFNKEYIDRYLNYQKKHKDLPIEQIITDVNIGIDNPYYTNTKKSINLNRSFILVNKYNYLPENYVPDNLEEIDERYARSNVELVSYAKDAFEKMAKAAKKENLTIIAMSTYRSYKYQLNLYNRYVETDGTKEADTYSARAGFSEHQTGLAVDVYNGKEDYTNFEKTKEYKWMQQNAYKYGFILRFPEDKTDQTGYEYESWHYRYVGTEIATYIHKNKICFEEYYVRKIQKG